MRSRPSLTAQILAGVGIPFVVVTILIGLVAWFSAQDEISEVYDSQLATTAQELWLLARNDPNPQLHRIGDEDLGLTPHARDELEEYARSRSFRVWKAGHLELMSEDALPSTVPVGSRGFTNAARDKSRWRVFVLDVPRDSIVVEVREQLAARREVSRRIVWGLCLPLLLILPIIGLAVWAGIRWGLKDLKAFANSVRLRSPNDLTQIAADRLPKELTPLSEAINQLFGKLQRSQGQERLFTDNAAHELRTPLAALAIQADVARNARTASERNQTLDELSRGVARTSRLLDQLLTLARIEHTQSAPLPLNLFDSAGDALREAFPNAHAKAIELSLSGDENTVIVAKRPLLGLLLGNLLDNAVKYSPSGSVVEVTVHGTEDGSILTICDRGPGIPEHEREKVFGRFYRVAGNSQAGSGLGLSIVRSICEIVNARIGLFTPADHQGLGVEVRFSTKRSDASDNFRFR